MAENAIVFSGTFDFTFSSGFGYTSFINPPTFTLVSGETYTVYWDGKRFVVTAYDATIPDLGDYVAIGNGTALGYQGNGEPFAIACNNSYAFIFAFEDDTATHEVTVYHGEVYEVGDSPIIVKDRNGDDVSYVGVTGIKVRTGDGNTKVFVDGDNIPEPVESTVELNFSEGDMEVVPNSGTVFEKLTIPKPDALVAENIVEGVPIAGIIGTFKGGGSGERHADDKPIRFYDPYGNVLYGYTKEEFLELSELPNGPSLPGLDFDMWSSVSSAIRSQSYFADVGPAYKRKSTATLHPNQPVHVAIIETLENSVAVSFTFSGRLCSVGINWGDGTEELVTGFSTTSSASTKTVTHTFATAGTYIVSISFDTSGTGPCQMGVNNNTNYVSMNSVNIQNSSTVYGTAYYQYSYHVISLLVGAYVMNSSMNTLNVFSLHSTYRLQFVSQQYAPNAYNRKFMNCFALKAIAGYASDPQFWAFRCAGSLERIRVSGAVAGSSFVGCNSLKEVIFGAGAISDNNMNSKWAMLMTTKTPPTISATNPKWGTYPIYVPDEAVETYKTASGWSNAADYILPESKYPA